MKLDDTVADVIYKQVIARPDDFPYEIVRWVDGIQRLEKSGNWTHTEVIHQSGTWRMFKGSIAEHADELQAICTENEL